MIRLRDEGGVIRQGFNVYPRGSVMFGFLFALGTWRWALRRSRVTGIIYCSLWRVK